LSQDILFHSTPTWTLNKMVPPDENWHVNPANLNNYNVVP